MTNIVSEGQRILNKWIEEKPKTRSWRTYSDSSSRTVKIDLYERVSDTCELQVSVAISDHALVNAIFPESLIRVELDKAVEDLKTKIAEHTVREGAD